MDSTLKFLHSQLLSIRASVNPLGFLCLNFFHVQEDCYEDLMT